MSNQITLDLKKLIKDDNDKNVYVSGQLVQKTKVICDFELDKETGCYNITMNSKSPISYDDLLFLSSQSNDLLSNDINGLIRYLISLKKLKDSISKYSKKDYIFFFFGKAKVLDGSFKYYFFGSRRENIGDRDAKDETGQSINEYLEKCKKEFEIDAFLSEKIFTVNSSLENLKTFEIENNPQPKNDDQMTIFDFVD